MLFNMCLVGILSSVGYPTIQFFPMWVHGYNFILASGYVFFDGYDFISRVRV
jgi:hypothetical protein